MASIRKRGDYQWQAEVRKKGYPAVRKTFLYKEDAVNWSRDTEANMQRGLFVDRARAEKTTVRDLTNQYRNDVLPSLTGKHAKSALSSLESVLGDWSVAGLTSELVSKYRDGRLKVVSPSTVRKEINLLSRVIDLAGQEWGIRVAINPCLGVSRPAEPRGRDRRLEGDEEERLLAECARSGDELEAIVRVALETAARLGELLQLKWKHINLTDGTARIFFTKNGDDRTLPLSPKAIAAIDSLKVRHINGRVFHNWAASDSFNKTWRRVCARAMIDDLRFHDLRHEAVSRLFERGDMSMMEIASISGHRTLTMLKRYTHLRAKDLSIKLAQ